MAPVKITYESREIRLPAGLTDGAVAFVEATVFDDPPLPFAIVKYAVSGELQKNGLRMDLDKRVFLDHFDDEKFEQTLLDSGQRVATAIGQARQGPLSIRAAGR